jgi:hypothetical protein
MSSALLVSRTLAIFLHNPADVEETATVADFFAAGFFCTTDLGVEAALDALFFVEGFAADLVAFFVVGRAGITAS